MDFNQPVDQEIVDLNNYLEGILSSSIDFITKGAVIIKPFLWKFIHNDIAYV